MTASICSQAFNSDFKQKKIVYLTSLTVQNFYTTSRTAFILQDVLVTSLGEKPLIDVFKTRDTS